MKPSLVLMITTVPFPIQMHIKTSAVIAMFQKSQTEVWIGDHGTTVKNRKRMDRAWE